MDLEDLISDFAITSPLPALPNTVLNVKNLMRIGNQTSFSQVGWDHVNWVFTTSPVPQDADFLPGQTLWCNNPPSGQQISPFCVVNGVDSVRAPSSDGRTTCT